MATGNLDLTKDVLWLMQKYMDKSPVTNSDYTKMMSLASKMEQVHELINFVIAECQVEEIDY